MYIVLIDMDNVIADLEKGVETKLSILEMPIIPYKDRNTLYILEQYEKTYGESMSQLIWDIVESEGFFRNLPPVEGAIPVLNEIEDIINQSDTTIEARICTVPLPNYTYCVPEKYEWVDEYLGGFWLSRIIMTIDKTLIYGDILLDDNPDPINNGAIAPSWQNVLFTQPFNQYIEGKLRLTWQDKEWRAKLGLP